MATLMTPLLTLAILYALYYAPVPPSAPLSMAGLSLVISCSIAAVIDLPTFFREARSPRDAKIAASALFLISLPLVECAGVFIPTLNPFFLLLAGFTANNANMYSAAVSLETLVPLPLRHRLLLICLIGTLLALFPLLENLEVYINTIGIIISSMGGVLIGYLLKKTQGSLLAWGLGALCGLLTGHTLVSFTVSLITQLLQRRKTVITVSDLDDLALGATVLGSGGGGDPIYDLMIAKVQLQKTGPVKLIQLADIDPDGLVVPLSFMGAPLVSIEKLPSGLEFEAIITTIEKTMGKKVDYLVATEIGGANALPPLPLASKLNLPVIDADTIGRAFPELYMSSCNVMGVSPSPAFMADAHGNVKVIYAPNAFEMETECRKVTMEMGSCAALCFYLMSGLQAKTSLIPGTVTQAINLGRQLRAGKPIAAPLATGTITDIEQKIEGGFLLGKVTIATPLGPLIIHYQNEYLTATLNNTLIASSPDILTLLETETNKPLPAESLIYGLRVSLLLLPSPAIWRTPRAAPFLPTIHNRLEVFP